MIKSVEYPKNRQTDQWKVTQNSKRDPAYCITVASQMIWAKMDFINDVAIWKKKKIKSIPHTVSQNKH